MMKRLTAVCILVTGIISQTVFAAPLKDDPGVESGIRLLERWIETQIAYKNIPALTVGVVHDQEIVWTGAFGTCDETKTKPTETNTIFRIASISKLFTSIAIMTLRDQGRLRLDDPVKQHLPWFDIKDRFPDAADITIRQLLTHSSGLPREAAFPYWTDFNFPTREQIREKLPEQETALPAATKWKYSNLGLALAGEIVAEVSGMPYRRYIEETILEPLGMDDTYVAIDPDHERLATGWGRRMTDGSRAVRPFTDSKGLTPAANLSSTVEDFAKFASWQFRVLGDGGTEILKKSTLRDMHRPHWVYESWTGGYGLGFSIRHTDDRDIVGHGGHVGGYRTQISLSPKEKIAVFVMLNTDDERPSKFVDEIFNVLAGPINKAAAPPAKEKKPEGDWGRYIGFYQDDWDDYRVMEYNGDLVVFFPRSLEPKSAMVTLKHEHGHVFRISGSGGVETGELCVFEMGADGRVERMKFGENYVMPVR